MRIIRKKELLRIIGVSCPTLWRWERKGIFPRRIQLGGCVGWDMAEIDQWLEERKAARGAK